MSQGLLCDLLNLVLDIMQSLTEVAFFYYDLMGLPAFNIREQLGLGSIGGCNI